LIIITNGNTILFTFVIVKFFNMKDRLLEFLKAENKSSAQLADEIGVQASGISHILSGRNNPSLDFVLKMLEKYKFLSTDWLLFGKGSMYKDPKMQSLFDNVAGSDTENDFIQIKKERFTNEILDKTDLKTGANQNNATSAGKFEPEVSKIVWFYDDNSFVEYFPRR
jgi:transcriptional regulator with XRE-family HTH domain